MRLLFTSVLLLCSALSVSAGSIEILSRDSLSPLSYEVTQHGGTETPFDNPYWDNHEPWIYVDIIDGTPLFSSIDKYDSGTWWPTFSKPIRKGSLLYLDDGSLWEDRTEVKARRSWSHLWHLFSDGPSQYNGVRYCMNSAALRFVPLADMRKAWYIGYLRLFK